MFDYYAQEIDGYAQYRVGDTVTDIETGERFVIRGLCEAGVLNSLNGLIVVDSVHGGLVHVHAPKFGLFVDYYYTPKGE